MEKIKKFEDFIEEAKLEEFDGKGQKVKYRWLDYHNDKWYETRCEVISYNEKRVKIKLLGFGPKGARPGTVMTRIKHSSLIGFKPEFPVDPDIEYEEDIEQWWHK